MTPPQIFIGIDVSKGQLDVAQVPLAPAWTAANDSEGIGELVKRLRNLKPALIVLEATGGYESAVVAAMMVASLPVVVVNPRQARDFARAKNRLAKTARSTLSCWRSSAKLSSQSCDHCRTRPLKS